MRLDASRPFRDQLLPYGRHLLEEDDIQAVVEVLRGDWLTTGPKVAEFEEAFASRVGAKHAVAFSSGTAALHGAAFAAGLGPGDEAITTPLTFAASANCILYQGATPVFADVDPETLNISPQTIEKAITPNTRALIPVDFTGQPCDLDAIHSLARRHGLLVIEDACHALGAIYRGRRIGSISDMTVFSTHPVKHATTGEGGVVTTNDAELARKLKLFRTHGIDSNPRQRQEQGSWSYEMVLLGYNYRLTDFQSALGISQLKKLDRFLNRRRGIAAAYREAFTSVPEITVPAVRLDVEHSWHIFVIELNLDRLTTDRAGVFSALRAENIGVNVHYIPVPWHPYYQQLGYRMGQWPVAENAYERLITLPLFPAMTDQDAADVIAAVRKVMAHYRR